jgi:hypothetical protein
MESAHNRQPRCGCVCKTRSAPLEAANLVIPSHLSLVVDDRLCRPTVSEVDPRDWGGDVIDRFHNDDGYCR